MRKMVSVPMSLETLVGEEESPASAISSLRIRRKEVRSLCLPQSFRFAPVQFGLAMSGGIDRVSSSLKISFFNEVAPTLMPV